MPNARYSRCGKCARFHIKNMPEIIKTARCDNNMTLCTTEVQGTLCQTDIAMKESNEERAKSQSDLLVFLWSPSKNSLTIFVVSVDNKFTDISKTRNGDDLT